MVMISSLLAQAVPVDQILVPSAAGGTTAAPPTGKKADVSLQLQVGLNAWPVEYRATTPEPDVDENFRGSGEATAPAYTRAGFTSFRLTSSLVPQSTTVRGGLTLLGRYEYERDQTVGQDRLRTHNTVWTILGGNVELESNFHLVGLPNDPFYIGMLSMQLGVGPALFNTRMTHTLDAGTEDEAEEDPVGRKGIGLSGFVQARVLTLGVGSWFLHAGMELSAARELKVWRGEGNGPQSSYQLFNWVVVLEKRYTGFRDLFHWRLQP